MARKLTTDQRKARDEALAEAKAWARGRSKVTAVYEGFQQKHGRLTKHECIVVSVAAKMPSAQVTADDIVPKRFGKMDTDVREAVYEPTTKKTSDVDPRQLTAKRRPCEAGWSIGHVDISAGTFGAPVRRGPSNEWLCLTNNHVAANSNDASIGDTVLQPGNADGGSEPDGWGGKLLEFVTINFEGAGTPTPPIPDIPCPLAANFDKLANFALKQIGSRYRTVSQIPSTVTVTQAISQPTPNLVDAALVQVVDGGIDPVIWQLGALQGIRDFALGDAVQKQGRTTEHTLGQVVGVNGQVQVQYGAGKIAVFDDQLIIESTGSGDFSAGGDSGSGIESLDMYIGGLLFAGGGGQTIANKISHVVSLLGIRV